MEHKENAATAPAFSLPITVITLIDIGRLQREVEAVELFLAQAAAREPGKSLTLPRTTHNLELLCNQNKLNLLVATDRQQLNTALASIRKSAPKVHISFATDPSAAFMQRIVSWFRTTVHPLVILQVGLQPNIAAGCIIRTSNRYFDLSLRKDFDKQKHLLSERLHEQRATPDPPPPPPPPEGKTGTGEKPQSEYSFSPPVIAQSPVSIVAQSPAVEVTHG